MREIVVIAGLFAWLIWGVAWVTPLKIKLMKLHGSDKSNKFFIELAGQGDPMAKAAVFRTRVLLCTGIGGVFSLALAKVLYP